METIGSRIKFLRKTMNMSQIEFAQFLDVDKSTVAKYETDAVTPSVNMIVAMAKFFETSADFLLCLTDEAFLSA